MYIIINRAGLDVGQVHAISYKWARQIALSQGHQSFTLKRIR